MLTRTTSPDAPAAVGPYTQAVRVGSLLFLSGSLGLNPATGKMVSPHPLRTLSVVGKSSPPRQVARATPGKWVANGEDFRGPWQMLASRRALIVS